MHHIWGHIPAGAVEAAAAACGTGAGALVCTASTAGCGGVLDVLLLFAESEAGADTEAGVRGAAMVSRRRSREISRKGSLVKEQLPHSRHLTSDLSVDTQRSSMTVSSVKGRHGLRSTIAARGARGR